MPGSLIDNLQRLGDQVIATISLMNTLLATG